MPGSCCQCVATRQLGKQTISLARDWDHGVGAEYEFQSYEERLWNYGIVTTHGEFLTSLLLVSGFNLEYFKSYFRQNGGNTFNVNDCGRQNWGYKYLQYFHDF